MNFSFLGPSLALSLPLASAALEAHGAVDVFAPADGSQLFKEDVTCCDFACESWTHGTCTHRFSPLLRDGVMQSGVIKLGIKLGLRAGMARQVCPRSFRSFFFVSGSQHLP